MVKHSHGFLHGKTRSTMKKKPRYRGKTPISKYIQKFEIGDKVTIDIEPSWKRGMPQPKFHGYAGEVVDKRGECYLVGLMDMNKPRTVIAAPVHLRESK